MSEPRPATVAPCPVCGAQTAPDDEFCEACGTRLSEPGDGDERPSQSGQAGPQLFAPDGAGPTARPSDAPAISTPTAPAGPFGRTRPCGRCGAPPSAIDPDGYCAECGLLQPSPRDHLEVDLGWAAGVTDRGRQHPRNEDAFHLEQVGPADDRNLVAVVCDGVSSSVKPEEAAEVAAQAAAAVLSAVVGGVGSLADATVHGIGAATKAVTALPWTARGGLASPSCTLVSAARRGRDLAIGSVGDSRAYWIDDEGSVRQLTVDDSWAEGEVEAGRMTEAEADADPRSHAITRWIGADAPEEDPRISTLTPEGGGRLLLCSDGLWNYAPTVDDFTRLLVDHRHAPTPLSLARALTDFALSAGGHDNITVVVAELPGLADRGEEKGTA